MTSHTRLFKLPAGTALLVLSNLKALGSKQHNQPACTKEIDHIKAAVSVLLLQQAANGLYL
jgi:hypothetical protein